MRRRSVAGPRVRRVMYYVVVVRWADGDAEMSLPQALSGVGSDE